MTGSDDHQFLVIPTPCQENSGESDLGDGNAMINTAIAIQMAGITYSTLASAGIGQSEVGATR